jgi:hypothetical protein
MGVSIMYTKSIFTTGDGIKAHIGYTSGKQCSSWASPYFTKEVAEQIMDEANKPYKGRHIVMHYVNDTDTFVYVVDGAIGEYKGEDIETEDGLQHLYGIVGWVWAELTEATRHNLALTVEDFIYDYDTYGYRDVGLEREETVEAIEQQLKDLTTFKQVYEIWQNEDLDIDEKFEQLSTLSI